MFIRVDGMGLHFHGKAASESEDLLQPSPGLQRRQDEQKVRHVVPAAQHAIDDTTVQPVGPTFFASSE